MKQTFDDYFEAVKIVDGREIDSVDPLVFVETRPDYLVISNGTYEYTVPIEDSHLWHFRRMEARD